MTTETPKPVEVTQADKFEREERFIVVKRKHLTTEKEVSLRRFLRHQHVETVECVVVESDWPEYETVWRMIEARSARPEAQSLPSVSEADGLAGALRECADKLWVLRCNSRDEQDRRAAERAFDMATAALRAQPNDSTPSPVGPVDELQRLGQEFDAVGAEGVERDAVTLLEYIRNNAAYKVRNPVADLRMTLNEIHDWANKALTALQAQSAVPDTLDGEEAAQLFHDTYERLAPSFGYETRADTKAFDPESPNGKLMIAVCNEVANGLVETAMGRARDEYQALYNEKVAALSRQPVEADGKCLICGGTRDQHDTGTGLLTCRGIAVPTYRPAPATGPSNEAEGWRDIETAPRVHCHDGPLIDLWHRKQGRLADCFWQTKDVGGRDPYWCTAPGGYNMGDDSNFTHWRPLPAAPGASVQAGGEVERP